MNAAILTNKLVAPVTNDLIHRPALCEQLNSQYECPLIVLQAAAGFGKTSTVCDWLQHSNSAIAWYSLDHTDNIPTTFWQYMCESLSRIHLSITEEARRFLTNQSINDVLPICDSLINGLNHFTRNRLRPNHCVLVLDDFHLIHDVSIIESIARFIDYKPYWLQVVITSRTLPELRIPKRISQGQAFLITNEDLMYDKQTCSDVLTQQINQTPNSETLNFIFEQTKGWPAAVQLLMHSKSLINLDTYKNAAHHELMTDYLMEEVFINLDEETKELLNIICTLPRFNLSVINSIIDQPISEGTFDKLIHSGLLISSLESKNNQKFYKIHDLIRDWLETNLATNTLDKVKTIRNKAIKHLIQVDAINDALILAQKNEDWALASNILGHHIFDEGQIPHFDFIQYQLNQFPEEQYELLPIICVLKASLLFHQNKQAEMIQYLGKGRKRLTELEYLIDNNPNISPNDLLKFGIKNIEEYHIIKNTLSLWVDLNLLYDGRLPELKTLSGEFILSGNHPIHYWQDHIRFIHAFMQENFKQAIEIGKKTLNSAKEHKDVNCSINTACWLAQALYQTGELKTALNVLHEIQDWLMQFNAINLPNNYVLYTTFGFLYLENLEFTKAFEMYRLVEQNISEFSEPRGVLYNQYHFKMRLLICTHQYDEAGEWLKEIYKYEEKHLRNSLTHSSFICQPDTEIVDFLYQLKLGNTMPIIQWAMNYQAPVYSPPIKQNVETWLQAIGLTFCGQDQSEIFKELLNDAVKNHNIARQVGLRLLISTIFFHLGKIEQSTELLISTLKLARDNQYKQLVLDSNPQVLNKLIELQSHPEVGGYCQLLLQADKEKSTFSISVKSEPDNTQASPNLNEQAIKQLTSLTKREDEILRLLAKGMRNQEIANHLAISLATVKRHIQNIYSKLDINSRTEAALLYTHA